MKAFTPEYFSLRNRVSYDQGHDKLGTLMEVSQSYGQMQGGIAAHYGVVTF